VLLAYQLASFVQSCAGVISLTATAEKYAVPDADKFLSWVIDDYKRLCEEAKKLAEVK